MFRDSTIWEKNLANMLNSDCTPTFFRLKLWRILYKTKLSSFFSRIHPEYHMLENSRCPFGRDFSLNEDMNTKKKVLIIDDEEDACLLLKRFFLKKNFEVFCSYTLSDGLSQVAKVHPDILFLDNNLPDGFGWEASRSILQANPTVEIHLISAYNNSMFDYNKMSSEVKVWQKPISFQKLDEQLSLQKAS
jgi:two-component system, OmpR family, response regulator